MAAEHGEDGARVNQCERTVGQRTAGGRERVKKKGLFGCGILLHISVPLGDDLISPQGFV